MRYYIQSQGQVWLVEQNGKLKLPTPEQVRFKVRPMAKMYIGKEDVMWCEAGARKGAGWVHRDDILTSNKNIEELAKLAAIRSYPRVTASVALIDKEKILLVKSKYGLAKGFWILPGGFVEYSEHPAEAVIRETAEEIGLKVGKLELLAVETDTFAESGFHFLMVFYTGKVNGKPKLENDEIAEAGWFTPKEALKVCKHPTIRKALKVLAGRIAHE